MLRLHVACLARVLHEVLGLINNLYSWRERLMKTSWKRFFRRVAAVTVVGGSAMMASAMNYAMAQVASDSGSDPAYADNWQGLSGYYGTTEDIFLYSGVPDNGGFGFQPWNFYYDYNQPGVNGSNRFINSLGGGNATYGVGNPFSSAYNNLGANAFTLSNGSNYNGAYAATTASRSFSAPLTVGKTFSFDIDNPALPSLPPAPFGSDGFIVSLSSGGTFGSVRVGLFAQTNFNAGFWDLNGVGSILDSTATSTGATISVTITGAETYDLLITPLGGGAPLYSVVGATMANAGFGDIDTLRVTRYSSAQTTNGRNEFYFDNLSIVPEPSTGALLLLGVGGTLLGRWRARNRVDS